jgi:hypothetical protein
MTVFACLRSESHSGGITLVAGLGSEPYLPGSGRHADENANGVRPALTSRQEEWESERSFRRIFAALCNVLTEDEVRELIVGYLNLVGWSDYDLEWLNEGHNYYVLHAAIERAETVDSWAQYARSAYPKAPKGFPAVGNPAKGPRVSQSGAIRLERLHRLPPGAEAAADD